MDLDGILPGEPPSDEEIAALEPMSDEYEAAVRKKWGYTSSETRTEAERHQAAARMLEKAGGRKLTISAWKDPLRSAEPFNAPSEFRPDPKPGKP